MKLKPRLVSFAISTFGGVVGGIVAGISGTTILPLCIIISGAIAGTYVGSRMEKNVN